MDPQLAGVLIAGIGAIIALFAAIYTRQSHRLNRQLVSAQESRSQPRLTLGIFDARDVSTVLYLLRFRQGRVNELPLLLNLENTGMISVHNLRIVLTINRQLVYGGLLTPIVTTDLLEGKFSRLEAKGPFERFLLEVSALNPAQRLSFGFPISLREASFGGLDVAVDTSEGRAQARAKYGFGFRTQLAITAQDSEPLVHSFTIEAHDTSTVTPERYMRDFNEERRHAWQKAHQPAPLRRRLLDWRSHSKVKLERVILVPVRANSLKSEGDVPLDRLERRDVEWFQGVRSPDGSILSGLIPVSDW